MMDLKLKLVFICIFAVQVSAFPQSVTDKHSFVVRRSAELFQQDAFSGKESSPSEPSGPPKIYEMHVDSNVTNRFAHTIVTSKVKNLDSKAQEAVFSIVLPRKAFISKFVMSIGGKEYDAYVREKEHAKKIYDQAVASGQGAGLVTANARDSNRFTVSVNVEPESKVIFQLTYEQLLERDDNQYELVINIHPKQPVKDLTVSVNINESQPLRFVSAPPIRSGNEISDVKGDLDPRAQIHHAGPNSAVVKFSPNLERQKELAKTLGTNADEGLSGQFVVQYDVERSLNGGEILLQDGYFVHFFAPAGVEPLPKYVLFVLDTSGSMSGTKMNQLKIAMKSILGELKTQDKFHLIDFSDMAKVLNLYDESASVKYPSVDPDFFSGETEEDIRVKKFPNSYAVNADNMKKANAIVDRLDAISGTNIADALKVALYLVGEDKKSNASNGDMQPMIIFLTDGDATVGITDSNEILSRVQEQNVNSVPIFCLSFGEGADKDLLQKLSLRNNGFSRHIYEAADASLQLQDFYKHISSPVMSNVTFKYVNETKEMSKTEFPILFEGSELVVVGQLDKDFNKLPIISGHGVHGPIELVPEVRKPVTRLERLWAYLTIQQLLDDMERTDNKTAYEKKTLDLALQYSFVTPVSSLVVVKPNATDTSIEPQPADKDSDTAEFDVVPYGLPLSLHAAVPEAADVEEYESLTTTFASTTTTPIPTTAAPTSTTTTPIPTTIAPVEELKSSLPWLNNTLNGDVISTSEGSYKLGLNETSTDDVPCPASPKNGPGLCKLLHECPAVHFLLTNVYIFQQFYCEMRGFAAVCCPMVPSN